MRDDNCYGEWPSSMPVKSIFDYMDAVKDDKEPNKKPPELERYRYDENGHRFPVYKGEK